MIITTTRTHWFTKKELKSFLDDLKDKDDNEKIIIPLCDDRIKMLNGDDEI